MPDNLFEALDEGCRDRLRKRGWGFVSIYGTRWWRRSDGTLVTEEEAFIQLERLEQEEQS